jgi:hypothetical protein
MGPVRFRVLVPCGPLGLKRSAGSARDPWPVRYGQIQTRGRFVAKIGNPVRETCPLDRRYMDEHILAAGIRLNETIPLRRIEPLHFPHRHVDFSMLKNQRWCQKFDKRKACPRYTKPRVATCLNLRGTMLTAIRWHGQLRLCALKDVADGRGMPLATACRRNPSGIQGFCDVLQLRVVDPVTPSVSK